MEIKKEPWSDHAWYGLEEALGEDLPDIKAEVEEGIAELWNINGHGYVVTRFEQHNNFNVLVLIAGQGFAKDGEDYLQCVKGFCNIAANIGADRVISSTHRKGIGRMLEKIGFSEVERKYELTIESVKNG